MRLKPKQLNQAGDTLVEVILAVAIISSVLTGAFLVSQRSALAVRNSQEQGEALQILQGQVELVRALALDEQDTTMRNGIYESGDFCIDPSNPDTRVDQDELSELFPIENDVFSLYEAECRDLQDLYNVRIVYDSSRKVFNFYARWYAIGGSKKQVQLSYRVYPSKPL